MEVAESVGLTADGITLRTAAEAEGLLVPFRRVCMLLDAPPDLDRSVFLINLVGMLTLIPESWGAGECFKGWGELFEWWSKFKGGGALPVDFPRSRDPRGGVQEIEWSNLTPFPIFWAAECETRDSRYLLFLAQLILTRYRNLQASPLADGLSYEDQYEAWADSKDFGREHKIRSPWRAAASISAVVRRQLLEMSVSYAAELAGMGFYEWATLENGRVPERGSAQFYSIAGVLKVDTDSLLQLANVSRTAAA